MIELVNVDSMMLLFMVPLVVCSTHGLLVMIELVNVDSMMLLLMVPLTIDGTKD